MDDLLNEQRISLSELAMPGNATTSTKFRRALISIRPGPTSQHDKEPLNGGEPVVRDQMVNLLAGEWTNNVT